ncbi:MAG TPA: hypothetical protein VND89_11665 [Acidimicrobiales bacterium]|nr:hypothetical protein [Acidimicrobiales bacterium]
MIVMDTLPANKEHFGELLDFGAAVIDVCRELGIEPVASGSLAVFAYTANTDLEINDLDLSCSELDFPRLGAALKEKGVEVRLTAWHVLQALRDDLKVEFDAREIWLRDLPGDYETLHIGDVRLRIIGSSALETLYQRGIEATTNSSNASDIAKNQSFHDKIEVLRKGRDTARRGIHHTSAGHVGTMPVRSQND